MGWALLLFWLQVQWLLGLRSMRQLLLLLLLLLLLGWL
jgi:hypothetical protein